MNDLIKISATISDAGVVSSLKSLSPELQRNLETYLDRAGEEVAREERVAAPKAFSTLANSIRVDRDGALSRFVGPHVAYALGVEKAPDRQPDTRLTFRTSPR